MDINGIGAVVTGGASGLGEAAARILANNGANVAILDMSIDRAEIIANDIGAIAIECDVSDAKSVENAFIKAKEKNGLCGLAISCAGIAPATRIVGRDGPMPLDDFEQVIKINLIGSFNIMRIAASQMAERPANIDGERGVIINTASVAAYEGQIGQAAYAASKGGIVSLTLPAAREFAKTGIRVNAIAPGLFGTPMLLSMPQEVQESLAATLPFPKRFGTPMEYAKLVLHLIDNPIINGEVIRIDNAIRMQAR